MEEISKRSILVVVSHDFGELGLAYDFTCGLDDYYNVCFALPKRLYESNNNLINFHCIQYQTDNDILEIYNKQQPEYIFLYSAFLLVPNQIFSIRSLRYFISIIKRNKAIVVTSDPFLGFTSFININDINVELNHSSKNILHQYILKYLTWRQLRQIHSILKYIPRLIPLGTDCLNDSNNYYCYYNNDVKTIPPKFNEQPYWLFVISELDYALQKRYLGEEQFTKNLAEKLEESSGLNKKPILSAPLPLIKSMKEIISCHIDYVCQFNLIDFKQLVVHAERAFYWNMISHSIYYRFVNSKPIHFFDRGHIYRMIPRLHDLAIESYYRGKEPDTIDIDKPLNEEILIQADKQFYDFHLPGLKQLHKCPNSSTIMRKLSKDQ